MQRIQNVLDGQSVRVMPQPAIWKKWLTTKIDERDEKVMKWLEKLVF